jgi:hypothetical protein
MAIGEPHFISSQQLETTDVSRDVMNLWLSAKDL